MWGGALFVVFNLADACLTRQAFALGETELNPIVNFFGFGDNLVIKVLLALAVVLLLWCFGKTHLFKYLNILMMGVIIWNITSITLHSF